MYDLTTAIHDFTGLLTRTEKATIQIPADVAAWIDAEWENPTGVPCPGSEEVWN